MLGGFSLTVAGSTINDSSSRARQLWNLLEYLITFRNRDISHEELISALWPDNRIDNPANALKNLIYRIRSDLAENRVPDSMDFILYKRGTYSYNNSLPTLVDTEEFERLIRTAGNLSLPPEERISLYQAALKLYTGDFLPKSSSEAWVIPLATYFHSMYLKAAAEVIHLLESQKRYEDVVDICEAAVTVDQLEEYFHESLIRAQLAMERPQKAMAHYEYVTGLFYRELGVKPSDSLRGLYREIAGRMTHTESDLDAIKEDLREPHEARGPFFCPYEVFRDMYQLEARSASRTGRSVFVALITLTASPSKIPDPQFSAKAMARLKTAICSSLRRGDVVSLFSPTQYVLMLPYLTFENGQMVMERIIRRFKKENPRIPVSLEYRLQPLDPVV